MHFAIRFLTEYHYDSAVTDNLNALRVRPATTSTQRCDEFHTRIEPEARVSRHLDYFGTEVIEFGIPTSHEQLTIDMRARVVTSAHPSRPRGSWDSLSSAAYVDAAGEFALPWQDQPAIDGHRRTRARDGVRAARSRRSSVLLRADPRPLRIPARGDLCRLDGRRPAADPGRASARTSSTSR